jgi:hypothetical protein
MWMFGIHRRRAPSFANRVEYSDTFFDSTENRRFLFLQFAKIGHFLKIATKNRTKRPEEIREVH